VTYSSDALADTARRIATVTSDHLSKVMKRRVPLGARMVTRMGTGEGRAAILVFLPAAEAVLSTRGWVLKVDRTFTLGPGESVNLDEGTAQGPGKDLGVRKDVVPLGTAGLAPVRTGSLEACLSAKYGLAQVVLDGLAPNSPFCVRTDGGSYSVVVLSPSKTRWNAVTVAARTWQRDP
jgi:hypothetical protein